MIAWGRVHRQEEELAAEQLQEPSAVYLCSRQRPAWWPHRHPQTSRRTSSSDTTEAKRWSISNTLPKVARLGAAQAPRWPGRSAPACPVRELSLASRPPPGRAVEVHAAADAAGRWPGPPGPAAAAAPRSAGPPPRPRRPPRWRLRAGAGGGPAAGGPLRAVGRRRPGTRARRRAGGAGPAARGGPAGHERPRLVGVLPRPGDSRQPGAGGVRLGGGGGGGRGRGGG